MIKVNKSEFLKALEKAAVIAVKDSYIVSVSDKKATDERNFASICVSDGNAMAFICFMVTTDKPCSFFAGPELLGVVKALGEFGDEYKIEVGETAVTITVGSASAPVLLKSEGTSFGIGNLKDEPDCIHATVEKDEFVKAVRQGSFAYGGDGCISGIVNSVAIHPETKEDEVRLCFLSSDGRLAVRSNVKTKQVNEAFKKAEKLFVNVDAPTIRAIISKLDGENITLFIFKKQILIKDGNDYYAILRYETEFPQSIGEMLNVTEYNYKIVFESQMLKAALDVATIAEEREKKIAVIDVHNKKVNITSVLGNNKAEVKAENVEGEVNIHVNAKHLKMVMDNTGAKQLTVYGQGDVRPLFMITDGFNGLMTPVVKPEEK